MSPLLAPRATLCACDLSERGSHSSHGSRASSRYSRLHFSSRHVCFSLRECFIPLCFLFLLSLCTSVFWRACGVRNAWKALCRGPHFSTFLSFLSARVCEGARQARLHSITKAVWLRPFLCFCMFYSHSAPSFGCAFKNSSSISVVSSPHLFSSASPLYGCLWRLVLLRARVRT